MIGCLGCYCSLQHKSHFQRILTVRGFTEKLDCNCWLLARTREEQRFPYNNRNSQHFKLRFRWGHLTLKVPFTLLVKISPLRCYHLIVSIINAQAENMTQSIMIYFSSLNMIINYNCHCSTKVNLLASVKKTG